MIIHVELCDHCDTPPRGGELTPYRITGDPTTFHICQPCQRKPFRRVPPSTKGVALRAVLTMALEAS